MKHTSILLYLPGLPLKTDALLPQRNIALSAAALAEAQEPFEIWDYGTVSALAETAHDGRQAAQEQRRLRWWPGPSRNSLARQHRRTRLLERLQAAPHDTLLLFVQDVGDYREALKLSQEVRKRFPATTQLLAGEYAALFNVFLVHSGAWDGVLTSGAELLLPDMLRYLRAPEASPPPPGLLRRANASGAPATVTPVSAGPLPLYDAATYPAIDPAQKFLLFTIPHHDWNRVRTNYCPSRWPTATRAVWRNRLEEMQQIQRNQRARVFHLTGGFGVDDLALGFPEAFRDLLDVEYAVELQMESLFSEMGQILHRSGCRVASMRLDSGSQRLLEDFYGRTFGVSSAEKRLLALAEAGIFTIGQFQFPCAEDDYHTRAETVRFASRSRLASAVITAPQVAPGSVWRQRPADFGFLLSSLPFPHRRAKEGADLSAVRGYTTSRSAAARETLAEELRCHEVGPPSSAVAVMLATISGEQGREHAYAEKLALSLGNVEDERTADLVGAFNSRALLPVNAFQNQQADIRAAVGN